MKSIKNNLFVVLITLIVISCTSKPSLQKYYIENQENQNFMVIDIPTSILNINEDSLSKKQLKTFKAIEKVNFLGFKKTSDNSSVYLSESKKVKDILADNTYKPLIKYGGDNQGAIIKYLGDDDAIKEVIIYGSDDTKGFGIVRILGNDMNPAQLIELIEVLKKSKPDSGAFKDIATFF